MSTTMSSFQDSVFDPHGDVLLVLTDHRTPASNTPTVDEDLTNKSIIAEATADEEDEEVEVEVKVSSRHLALASRVFRIMFDGNFSERLDFTSTQPKRIPLPDDDFEAMVIILNIIHGLNKRVSRTITMPLFTKVAILIDKYEFHEVAEVYSDIWFEDLWDSCRPTSVSLTEWIYLSWVFRKESDFRLLTKRVMMDCSREHLEVSDLPFPEKVVAGVEDARTETIGHILEYLATTIERYSTGQRQCKTPGNYVHCDSLVLGDLIRELKCLRLFPIPDPTSIEVSIEKLFVALRKMKLTSLCTVVSQKYLGDGEPRDCSLQRKLHAEIDRLESQVFGLELTTMEPHVAVKRDINDVDSLSEAGSVSSDKKARRESFLWVDGISRS